MLPVIATGTYTYRAALNAQPAGVSSIVVTHTGGATQISETTSGNVGGVSASATATLALGSNLAPMSYSGKYEGGGQSAASSVTFAANVAQVSAPSGKLAVTLAPPATHFAVLDGALLAGYFALPAEMQAWSNAPAQAISPVYDQAVTLTLAPAVTAPRPADVPKSDIAINLSASFAFTLWYDPTTFITDEIDVPSQGIVVSRTR